MLSLEKKKEKRDRKQSGRQSNVGSRSRANGLCLKRQVRPGRFMFKPLCKQLFVCSGICPLTFLCFSDLFVNHKYFLLNLALLMSVDFFDVTSVGIAQIFRLWGRIRYV